MIRLSILRKQALALVLLGLSGVFDEGATAAMVSLAEAGVSFDVPSGFSALNADEMRLIYQTGQPPKYAVGNEARTTTIGYDLAQATLRVDQLKEAKPAIESQLERTGTATVFRVKG